MQFIDNLKASYAALPGETKKVLIILVSVGGGLVLIFLLMITIFLSPSQRSTSDNTDANETVSTPEEITAMTLAPAKPTNIPFISKEDIEAVIPQFTPTPTPLPGVFYTPNGQQNDLEIVYAFYDQGDTFYEIRLRNKKTLEVRPIGNMYRFSPGNSAFFSPDFSQVIYLGGTKIDYQKITFYSIPLNRNLKYITLDQMKAALPDLQIDESAVFSRLVASPYKSKVALSFGNTFYKDKIDPDTQIIVIRLADNKMQMLSVKGLVKEWTNESTLQYETNTPDPNLNTTLETTIIGL